MDNLQTLKGFRDFLPEESRKRQYVINSLKEIFESLGFEPLETPTLEYAELLQGKYGEEGEKLMYKFQDHGGRFVAMRYDQTVPLARVVSQYGNLLPSPFKRYQIQNVWRADNTQRGRFREFTQCDIDTVGINTPLSDAEVIAVAINAMKKLGFRKPQMWINDRSIFNQLNLTKAQIMIIDKLDKIGEEMVISQLEESGLKNAKNIITHLKGSAPTQELIQIFEYLREQGLVKNEDFLFSPLLARGLDYYTGSIFELKTLDLPYMLSLGGGGRYNNLIGIFAKKEIPAVGFAFGFDRVLEAMTQLNLFPSNLASTEVLVTIFSPDLLTQSIKVSQKLREENINTELWLDPSSKLDKQLKYADQKNIRFAVIIGPDEISSDQVVLKDLTSKTQKAVPAAELTGHIKNIND